ncbi:hypothetical protein Bca4012_046683 [Brassica carinata]
MSLLRFVASFFAGSLYFILVITISSTAAAAPLCISAVHALMLISPVHAPLVVVNSSSPFVATVSHAPPPLVAKSTTTLLLATPLNVTRSSKSTKLEGELARYAPFAVSDHHSHRWSQLYSCKSFVLLRFFSDPLAFTSSQPLTLLLLVTAAVKAPLPHLRSHRSLRFRWQYYFNVNNLSPAPDRRSFSNSTTPPPRTIVTPHHLSTIDTISAQTYPAHHRALIVWMWLSFAHGWVSKDPLSTSAHTSCFRDLCMCAGTPITGYCSFSSTSTNLISNNVLVKVSDWANVLPHRALSGIRSFNFKGCSSYSDSLSTLYCNIGRSKFL